MLQARGVLKDTVSPALILPRLVGSSNLQRFAEPEKHFARLDERQQRLEERFQKLEERVVKVKGVPGLALEGVRELKKAVGAPGEAAWREVREPGKGGLPGSTGGAWHQAG